MDEFIKEGAADLKAEYDAIEATNTTALLEWADKAADYLEFIAGPKFKNN